MDSNTAVSFYIPDLSCSVTISIFASTLAFSSVSGNLGPVVQSVVSLTSSLRVISLTVLADSKHNILVFFAGKM